MKTVKVEIDVDGEKFRRWIELGNKPWIQITDSEAQEYRNLEYWLGRTIWQKYCGYNFEVFPHDRS